MITILLGLLSRIHRHLLLRFVHSRLLQLDLVWVVWSSCHILVVISLICSLLCTSSGSSFRSLLGWRSHRDESWNSLHVCGLVVTTQLGQSWLFLDEWLADARGQNLICSCPESICHFKPQTTSQATAVLHLYRLGSLLGHSSSLLKSSTFWTIGR